ncbi:unnamed protein product [Trifolium pratense]|uniref:Uncharacterized protein n=1 Tax=Trifolium pratense TaxID=57577 RepID=A0ACB0LTP8_TRIPR|nr:unnamed protein product [Trifolium pratense]
MSRGLDAIKNINDTKELWKLAVRFEDIWTLYSGTRNEHIEFLILDKQGDNIQVEVNDFKIKFSDHPFKLVVTGGEGGTSITPKDIPNIPLHKFEFKSFSDIKRGEYQANSLVDIIGAVNDGGAVKTKYRSKEMLHMFSLETMLVTLWGVFGSTFTQNFNEHGNSGPFIVVLKHAKIKEPEGQYELTVTNAWNGTKLIVDQELKEIKDFIKTFPDNYTVPSSSQQGGSKQGEFTV